jgi:hypothetical protein
VPVEVYYSIEIIERYYALIRRAYTIITEEIKNIDRNIILQMAFKIINNMAGSNGLILIFLVYGAYLRIIKYNSSTPIIAQRAAAIKKTITELRKIKTKTQIYNILNIRNKLNITKVHDLPLNSDVIIWREGNTGQFKN